jgi:ubiquinone/menaquinone biosynthesis C-methylase UbiE
MAMAEKSENAVLEHLEVNEKKWDSWAGTYDNKRFDFFRYLQKKAVSLTRLKEGQSFLDIGCGTGWAVCYASGLMNGNGKFYGIDLSSKMVGKALENSGGHKNTYFYNARVEELPFESNFIDVAICTNSFHHYLDPSKALDEIYRVLKPGGRIYIMDATADGLLTKFIEKHAMARQPDHVKIYSTREYRELFSKSRIKYVTTTRAWPEKVHIGEKAI